MTEAKKKELLGWGCTILGGIFVVAGVLFFIMSNKMNLQLKKTEASIIGQYDIQLEDGQHHTMLELTYRVGDEMVIATYEYPGFINEDVTMIDIYYNIKDPQMVVDGAMLWEPLLVLVLGLIVLVPGLYLKGIIKNDLFKIVKPSDNAGNLAKELYQAKQRVMEGILPMLAGILFVVFGIIMLINDWGWWAWLFIIAGCVELLYIGLDFAPAVISWYRISKLQRAKNFARAYDIEMTENKEKSEEE